MEAVARDSIGEDVQLNSHLGSELLGRFPWCIAALEVERCDFVQRQRRYGLGKRIAARVDETAANGDTICYVHVDEVEPSSLTDGQTDGSQANGGNGKDVLWHTGLSSAIAARIGPCLRPCRATLRSRISRGAWRERKRKRQHCGCE